MIYCSNGALGDVLISHFHRCARVISHSPMSINSCQEGHQHISVGLKDYVIVSVCPSMGERALQIINRSPVGIYWKYGCMSSKHKGQCLLKMAALKLYGWYTGLLCGKYLFICCQSNPTPHTVFASKNQIRAFHQYCRKVLNPQLKDARFADDDKWLESLKKKKWRTKHWQKWVFVC